MYYITVTLKYADFGQKPCRYTDFWKKIILLHKCNLTKHGFELHGFFLEPKTAHLEALLYFQNFAFLRNFCIFRTLLFAITFDLQMENVKKNLVKF